jgi:hypothetical protein
VYINASLLVFWKEKIGCRRWAWILGVGGFSQRVGLRSLLPAGRCSAPATEPTATEPARTGINRHF